MIHVRIEFNDRAIIDAAERGSREALSRSGAYVRKTARNKVLRSETSSSPGIPPHSRKGLLKRSIVFGLDRTCESVLIGPAYNHMGPAMHEYGGRFRGRSYPKRPLMGPSLQQAAPHLSKFWEDSIKL
jgi:hypothetical protein